MEVVYNIGFVDVANVYCRGATKEDAATYVREEGSQKGADLRCHGQSEGEWVLLKQPLRCYPSTNMPRARPYPLKDPERYWSMHCIVALVY